MRADCAGIIPIYGSRDPAPALARAPSTRGSLGGRSALHRRRACPSRHRPRIPRCRRHLSTPRAVHRCQWYAIYGWSRANAAYGRVVAILHFPLLVPAAAIAKNRVLILVGMLSVNNNNRRERPYAGARSRDGIIGQEPAKSARTTPKIERDTSTSVRSIGRRWKNDAKSFDFRRYGPHNSGI